MSLLNSGSKSVHEHFAGGNAEWMGGVQARDRIVAFAGQRVREVAFMNNHEKVAPTLSPAEAAAYAAPVPTEQSRTDLDYQTSQIATVPDKRAVTTVQFQSAEAELVNSDSSAEARIVQALQAAEAARREQGDV